MAEVSPRVQALIIEAVDRAAKVYKHAFPSRAAACELTVDYLNEAFEILTKELTSTNVLLRQRAAINVFLAKWEKECAKEAAKK